MTDTTDAAARPQPTMLFRPGDTEIIWDIACDTIVVDAAEVEDHLAAGWYRHLFDFPAAAPEPKLTDLLDLSAAKLTEQLADLTLEQLLELRDAESAGKTRKSVLAAIDAAAEAKA